MKNKFVRFAWVPLALGLSACEVQVTDSTPAQYQANNDIGMYEVTATTKEGALVTPGSVVLFAIGDGQKVRLNPNSDGSGYSGLFSVRCQPSFPLQIQAVWRLQGLSTRNVVEPPQPRQIKLIEPPLTKQAGFDTSAKPAEAKGAKGKAAKGEWTGAVEYRFVTIPMSQITGAHVEPSSGSAEDIAAARAITVKSTMPMQAPCGEPVQVQLASSQPRAHGTLVIDIGDNPSLTRWQTYVEFSPK